MESNDMLIAMMTGWASLAGLMIGLFAWLRSDMKAGEDRLRSEIRSGDDQIRSEIRFGDEQLRSEMKGLEERLNARIDRLEDRLGAVEHDVARIGGLLEGLRESITDRARSVAAE